MLREPILVKYEISPQLLVLTDNEQKTAGGWSTSAVDARGSWAASRTGRASATAWARANRASSRPSRGGWNGLSATCRRPTQYCRRTAGLGTTRSGGTRAQTWPAVYKKSWEAISYRTLGPPAWVMEDCATRVVQWGQGS
jgi:hypothetical protein